MRAFARGEALMALVIPLEFASKVKQGIHAPIQVIFDGSDSKHGHHALGYLKAVAAGFDIALQEQRIRRAGLKMVDMPLEARIRVWFNPELKARTSSSRGSPASS